VYWNDYDNMLPAKHNPGGSLPIPDARARFDYMIYCGNPQNTVHTPDFVNAGALFKEKIIGDGNNYICPTIKKNVGGVWWDKEPLPEGAQSGTGGWWPVNRRHSSNATYGRRRFNYYDNPDLSSISYRDHQNDLSARADADIMLFITGVDAVAKPGDFSWMADRFESGAWALISHVPGVNVSFLDGHVTFWEDPTWNDKEGTGKVLYDNGLAGMGWSDPYSDWYYDDIWQIIDGYHKPPVGQGH